MGPCGCRRLKAYVSGSLGPAPAASAGPAAAPLGAAAFFLGCLFFLLGMIAKSAVFGALWARCWGRGGGRMGGCAEGRGLISG